MVGGVIYFFLASPSQEEAWNDAQETNTKASYSLYLEQHPDGENKSIARSKIKKFTNVERVKSALDDYDFKKAKNDTRIKAFHAYVTKYPNGRHIQAAYKGAWKSAQRQNSSAAYDAFLAKFPASEYRAVANSRAITIYKARAAESLNKVTKSQNDIRNVKVKAAKQKREAAQRASSKKTGCYSGDCSTSPMTRVFEDGGYYKGEIDINTGEPDGQGYRSFADGSSYEGGFRQWEYHGLGRREYSDGTSYTGGWKGNKRHGKGHYNLKNGTFFEENYTNGEIFGPGKSFYPDGGYKKGVYVKGKLNGSGTRVWADGDRFTGNYKNGEWHGKGRYIWADGSMYIGDYKGDRRNGVGKYYDTNGELSYYGNTIDNEKVDEGNGKLWSKIADIGSRVRKATKEKRRRRRKKGLF
ncbi:MAG: hypothetical protein V3V02_05105 [Rhizobiaceae bacterium]